MANFVKEDMLENITDTHVYTVRTIVVSTLLGGVFAGGYMIYQNFKIFDDHTKAVATVVISIATTIAIIATGFFPALDSIPSIFYTIAITLGTSLLTKKYQGDLIFKHIEADGKIHSTGRAVLICVISILLLLSIIFGAFFLQDATITEY